MITGTALARGQYPVFVADAHERMSLGVVRSLGRAGYPVHTCSSRPHAMAMGSRYVTCAVRSPPYSSDKFSQWLREYCSKNGIRCIVPGEEMLMALRPVFDEFAPMFPLSNDEQLIYRGMSKFALFSTFLDDAGRAPPNVHLPPLMMLRADDDLPDSDAFEKLSTPLFVKTDTVHAQAGAEGVVHRLNSASAARNISRELLKEFDRVMVQGNVTGVGVGAFVLRWNGRVLARFMHKRLHELPSSGWSSYRQSWWHAGIMADAERKLEQFEWQGVAMMEYRWDPVTDDFRLLEMNGRFWGSLHLALYAGVDFPRILVDAFFGHPSSAANGYDTEVRCRHLALELRYVWSRLRASDAGLAEKFRVIPEFLLLSINPRIKSDLWFPGDRRVWWLQFRQYLSSLSRR